MVCPSTLLFPHNGSAATYCSCAVARTSSASAGLPAPAARKRQTGASTVCR